MLRVQCAEGTQRVELSRNEPTIVLFERVHEVFRLSNFAFGLHKDRQRKEEILSSKSRTLAEYGLQHGDMLYMSPLNGALIYEQPSTSAESNQPTKSSEIIGISTQSGSTNAAPKEDDVDLELYKESGNIQRTRDDKLCRHNSKGCCVHCSPLEPWDEGYLKEHNIKHLSFHSYLRKQMSGKFVSLDELSCKIKPGCKEHPPWPRGVCSTCTPSAVTLNRQRYRHVDNAMIQHSAIVERFLQYWRATGYQRLGFMYGRYEKHPDVPLGIRATVAAIYEPPQSCSRDFITLEEDPKQELVDRIAAKLGLRKVGWLFTDLIPQDVATGTVKQVRGVDSHFLSAQECIMAGHLQNQHPNACRYASNGYFGSKFITVLITGDSNNQVHMEGYQVSGQCQALVRDNCLLPTRDAPELGYIRDSSDKQYVPDVYYKERDAYGNEVGVSARRLPVAYLLVDMPCGLAPANATPMFSPRSNFPPEHRPIQKYLQTLKAFHQHLQESANFLEAMSDFHVLIWLASNETLAISEPALEPLLDAVRNRDLEAAERWRELPGAATLESLAELQQQPHSESIPMAGAELWTCPHCTFHNQPSAETCEMCALPK